MRAQVMLDPPSDVGATVAVVLSATRQLPGPDASSSVISDILAVQADGWSDIDYDRRDLNHASSRRGPLLTPSPLILACLSCQCLPALPALPVHLLPACFPCHGVRRSGLTHLDSDTFASAQVCERHLPRADNGRRQRPLRVRGYLFAIAWSTLSQFFAVHRRLLRRWVVCMPRVLCRCQLRVQDRLRRRHV